MNSMNEKDYISDLENTIKNVVNDIRESRDYQNIKHSASDIGNRIMDEVNSGIKSAQNFAKVQAEKQSTQCADTPKYTPKYNVNWNYGTGRMPRQSVGGILLTVFGSIITFSFSLAVLEILFVWLFFDLPMAVALLLLVTVFDVGGIVMLVAGIKKINMNSRFKKYIKAIDGQKFASIESLCKAASCKPDRVCSDLNAMVSGNYIGKVIFDTKKEFAFFSDEVYAQYLESRKKQEEEQHRIDVQQNSKIIKDGWQYLKEIEATALDIACASIRQKALSLCGTAEKIMEFVTDNPEKSDEIKKFSSYYLPSTLNILETYLSFEAQGINNSDIQKITDEIEDMLDVSALAFKRVFGSLYDDDIMDVSTDIAAMQAMMAQEGLIDSFEIAKNKDNNEGDISL